MKEKNSRSAQPSVDLFIQVLLGIYRYLLIDPADRHLFRSGKEAGHLTGLETHAFFDHFNNAVNNRKETTIWTIWTKQDID
jgi:hypothetical protein